MSFNECIGPIDMIAKPLLHAKMKDMRILDGGPCVLAHLRLRHSDSLTSHTVQAIPTSFDECGVGDAGPMSVDVSNLLHLEDCLRDAVRHVTAKA